MAISISCSWRASDPLRTAGVSGGARATSFSGRAMGGGVICSVGGEAPSSGVAGRRPPGPMMISAGFAVTGAHSPASATSTPDVYRRALFEERALRFLRILGLRKRHRVALLVAVSVAHRHHPRQARGFLGQAQ